MVDEGADAAASGFTPPLVLPPNFKSEDAPPNLNAPVSDEPDVPSVEGILNPPCLGLSSLKLNDDVNAEVLVNAGLSVCDPGRGSVHAMQVSQLGLLLTKHVAHSQLTQLIADFIRIPLAGDAL